MAENCGLVTQMLPFFRAARPEITTCENSSINPPIPSVHLRFHIGGS